MNILVTGCAGFIGSVVTERLVEAGHNVIGVDDLRSSYIDAVHPYIKFYQKSIADTPHVEFSEKIDCVCHLAAESIIGLSVSCPSVFFKDNVVDGIEFLEAMLASGCKDIIYSSTASVYGDPLYTPIDESHPTFPINAYGESKLMFEKVLEWYRVAYGLRYCFLRYFNVGGATLSHGEHRKDETRLVPTAIDAIMNKKPVSIFGGDWRTHDGTCERDYLHVKDVADAHILAIDYLKKKDNAIFNLGGEKAYSVLEIVHAIEDMIGRKAEIDFTDRRPGDPEKLLASSDLAKRELGWNPQFSDLDTILRDSYWWYWKSHGHS